MMSDNSIEFSSLEAEASSEHTPVSRLTELAHQSLELARIIAKNQTAPSDLLAELSTCKDRLTRQYVTQNPNTSVEVLFELGGEFPNEFFNNPVFPLLSLENPNWIEMLPVETLRPLLRSPRGQQELLERFLNYPDSQTRAKCFFFLSHKDCPTFWLEKFVNSIYKDVRITIAFNPSVTTAILEQLARDSEPSIRALLASDPTIPASVLEQFASDSEIEVRQALSGNINAPLSVLKRLAGDRVAAIRCRVAQNLKTPKAILIKLATDSQHLVRLGVADNPNTPVERLKILAKDTSYRVRLAVAENPQTPPSILTILATDTSNKVRLAVAKNYRTLKETLRILTADADRSVSKAASKTLKIRHKKAAFRK